MFILAHTYQYLRGMTTKCFVEPVVSPLTAHAFHQKKLRQLQRIYEG